MSARFTASVMGAFLTLGSVAVALLPQPAYAQQKDAKALNPKVGTPLQAALAAAKNKQFDVAMAKVKEAETGKSSAYEQFKIYETLAFIYNGQKKYVDLAGVYEKMIETPQFLGEQSQINAKIIAQLYASAQQYGKTIDYSKRWLQERPNDPEALYLLGQSYYATKDIKSCKDTMTNAIGTVEKSGGRPAENWLALSRSCADGLGDSASAAQTLEKLVRYYPKPDVWQPYIRSLSRNSTDLAEFHWSRLMSEVGVLREPDDCSNYAQQAMLVYGSPAEAQRVVEECFKKGILGADPKSKARHEILLNKAKEAALADKARWPQLAAEADENGTGEKAVAMGLAYFGSEQYDQAISYLDKGIKKGGVKELAHAKLTLGVAQLKKGQSEAARATFKSLANDQALGKVAAAWTIRSYN